MKTINAVLCAKSSTRFKACLQWVLQPADDGSSWCWGPARATWREPFVLAQVRWGAPHRCHHAWAWLSEAKALLVAELLLPDWWPGQRPFPPHSSVPRHTSSWVPVKVEEGINRLPVQTHHEIISLFTSLPFTLSLRISTLITPPPPLNISLYLPSKHCKDPHPNKALDAWKHKE